MVLRAEQEPTTSRLYLGIVLRVDEDDCEVLAQGCRSTVRYARAFPAPRTERVSPGHLVALAVRPDRTTAVVWRWYDAVIVNDDENGVVRLCRMAKSRRDPADRMPRARWGRGRTFPPAYPVRTGGSQALP